MDASNPEVWAWQMESLLDELVPAGNLRPGRLIVFGVSTSEVLGKHIGTAGAEEVAAAIHAGVERARQRYGFVPMWQCCEHLNRALVVERETAEALGLTEVSAVPVPKAGGSMAAYAYRRMREPCLVEAAQAHAGVDIGETLIGMHLRPVAVPFRPTVRWIGAARVNAAYTRPKLIGGARAVYAMEKTGSSKERTESSDGLGGKSAPGTCD